MVPLRFCALLQRHSVKPVRSTICRSLTTTRHILQDNKNTTPSSDINKTTPSTTINGNSPYETTPSTDINSRPRGERARELQAEREKMKADWDAKPSIVPWILLIAAMANLFYWNNRLTQNHIKAHGNVSQVDDSIQLGGTWTLTDQNGKTVSSEQYKGKNQLIYFGFTHCPDICPMELKKIQSALRYLYMKLRNPELDLDEPEDKFAAQSNAKVSTFTLYEKPKQYKIPPQSDEQIRKLMPVPIFVSVDPQRDTPERLQEYSKQWMPYIIWCTGTYEQLKDMTNKFRSYMNIPDNKDSNKDYLVDHSIYWYFVGPTQRVDDFFGQRVTDKQVAKRMYDQICQQVEANKNRKRI